MFSAMVRKQVISAYIIIALVITGFVGFFTIMDNFDYTAVEAQVIIVDKSGGGNYTKIQDAIDNASDGDTIRVWAGTYSENVVVTNNLNLIGNSSMNTTINAGAKGVGIKVVSDNVNITGFTITNSGTNILPPKDAAIQVVSSEHVNVYNNNITGNPTGGIYFIDSANSSVLNNILYNNFYPACIEIRTSTNITITNNTALKNGRCVYLYYADNNNISFNKGVVDIYGSHWNTIFNNTDFDDRGGIYGSYCDHNTVFNNTLRNESMDFMASDWNTIYNNNVTFGETCLELDASNYNRVCNNTFSKGQIGINLKHAMHTTIKENEFYSTGITFFGLKLTEWDTHEIDESNTVNGKKIRYVKNQTGGSIPANAGQVIIVNSTDITVSNQDLNNVSSAVQVAFSDKIDINNNSISNVDGDFVRQGYGIYNYKSPRTNIADNRIWDIYKGIYIISSDNVNTRWNTVKNSDSHAFEITTLCRYSNTENNTFVNSGDGVEFYSVLRNNISGNILENNRELEISSGGDHNIFDNFCRNNVYGIFISSSGLNRIHNNTILQSTGEGLYVSSGTYNEVKSNNCSNNQRSGIRVGSTATDTTLINNTCISNTDHGMQMGSSKDSLLENNFCMSNGKDGINFYNQGHDNTMVNNTLISNTGDGIKIDSSWPEPYNFKIENNNISSNTNGIYFNYVRDCVVDNNTISSNTGHGLYLESTSYDNAIYHNNIISNNQQAYDGGNNEWNNTQQEGNYWSDYTGVDDGSGSGKHANAGDGIGDTNLPHLGLDNFPYVKRSGWKLFGNPVLQDPGSISLDGNYSISWMSAARATDYILEEDDNGYFTSPTVIYNGPGTEIEFKLKSNGTYYYHVKAYNAKEESDWSSIVNISVDWPPSAPTNFLAYAVEPNQVWLSWEKRPEPDIAGINIYINSSGGGVNGPFDLVYTQYGYATGFIYGPLVEETTYYMILKAFDKNNSYSVFSNVVVFTTPDGTAPPAPTGLTAVGVANDKIDLSWDASTAVDLAGYKILINETGEGPTGFYKLIETLTGSWTDYRVTGLTEQVEYYFTIIAFDEVPNNSSVSNIASATTPDIIPPSVPSGLTVTDKTSDSLTITWDPNPDHDVVGYFLYHGKSILGPFNPINLDPIMKTEFTDTGLKEDTEYFYKLKAIDDADLRSDFSKTVSGITLIGQAHPEIINPLADFSIPEDSYVDDKIDLSNVFEDVNDDVLIFGCQGQDNILVTIYQGDGTVVLEPKQNWNGKETLTFSATDDFVVYVQDSVEITVTAVNDRPFNASIYSAQPGYYENGNPLFTGDCDDPDMIYGDELTFAWYTNVDKKLGEGKELNLEPYFLDPGVHEIKLVVTDSKGLSTETTLDIDIYNLLDGPPGTNNGTGDEVDNKGLIVGGIVIVVVLVVLIAIFLLIRRRNKGEAAEEKPSEPPQVPVQPPAQAPAVPAYPQYPQQPVQQPLQQPEYYPQLPEQDFGGQQQPSWQLEQPQEPAIYQQPAEQQVQPMEMPMEEAPVGTQTEPAHETTPEEPAEHVPEKTDESEPEPMKSEEAEQAEAQNNE